MIEPNILITKYPRTEYRLEGYFDLYADRSSGNMMIHVVGSEGDVGDLDVEGRGIGSEEAAKRAFHDILPEYDHLWRGVIKA